MPAYPTHTLFSHMALLGLIEARHPLAAIAQQHAALFRVAGIAGCDIQCMPYQVCRSCGAPYRHNQGDNKTCAVCGKDALSRFSFTTSDKRRLTRVDIERDLYRNTHLVLGRFRGYGVDPTAPKGTPEQPFPRQVVEHLANVLRDARKIARRRNRIENYIGFTLGWFSHVVSDALFKGVYPETARVNFFGHQYNMAMLPAAETISFTDLSYDFGVNWPTWHRELLEYESDGGALRHLAMGNDLLDYDPIYWSGKFGKPDPSIGKILDALPRLNRKWFHAMYLTPDYTAASPRLDKRKIQDRANWTFEGKNLGELRRYAFGAGWYETFIKGIELYWRVVNEATADVHLDKVIGSSTQSMPPGHRISLSLWRRIVAECRTARDLPDDWGSSLQIDPRTAALLRQFRREPVRLLMPDPATDYQQQLAQVLKTTWQIKPGNKAERTVIIGPPSFNEHAAKLMCFEDMLWLKYKSGLAGVVKVNPEGTAILIAGLSDFGDHKLAQWLENQSL